MFASYLHGVLDMTSTVELLLKNSQSLLAVLQPGLQSLDGGAGAS